MARNKKVFICNDCGNEFPKWQGQCPDCGAWNSISEFNVGPSISQKSRRLSRPKKISQIKLNKEDRIKTNISEFDQVLGGGLIPGSLILLSGQPGIGKSTLLLQVVSGVIGKTLYISGEESEEQIKSRYLRLGLTGKELELLSSQDLTNLDRVTDKNLKLIIVDSIQTVFDSNVSQSPGGVTQIKACGYKLQQIAKQNQVPIIVTGHITKQGKIAGPMTLEHLVDAVFYLEGDNKYDQRILKSVKNRYGSTGEAGIFKMTRSGLIEVDNPSSLFLSGVAGAFGSTVGSVMEGQRSLLIEVQALAEHSVFGYPKRRAQGISANRLEVLSAVISNKTNLNLSDKDIYVNIVGGISVDEPAIDLPVALSIASAVNKKPLKSNLVCFGEVGLSGEVRPVASIEPRLKEARRQGFKKALVGKIAGKSFKSKEIEIVQVSTLKEAIKEGF